MMRLLMCLTCLLAACATPGPYFRGKPAVRITVADSVFDVRVRGELAEALRVNPQYAPRLGVIGDRARLAMQAVSGCRVQEIRGDQAMITGILNCGDGPDRPVPRTTGSYECYPVGPWIKISKGDRYVTFECDPI